SRRARGGGDAARPGLEPRRRLGCVAAALGVAPRPGGARARRRAPRLLLVRRARRAGALLGRPPGLRAPSPGPAPARGGPVLDDLIDTRKCPFCGEAIRSEAIQCRFCGSPPRRARAWRV